jgi:O-antigen/teichoic acid export membrane protein
MQRSIQEHSLLSTLFPLLKQSAIYLIGAGVVGMGNFILVPLYTRFLTAAEFGVYSLIEILLLIAVTTTQLGLSTTYVRWYAETEDEKRGELLASCVFAALVAGAAGGSVLLMLVKIPGMRWAAPLHGLQWVLLLLVMFRNLQGVLFSVLQAAQRAAAYSVAAGARLVVLSAAGIWFVGMQREGVRGILHGWLAGETACLLFLLVLCKPRQQLRISFSLLKPMLKYGFPLVWSSFMALLLDATGRFFLAKYQSLAEVGLYTVGIKITALFAMGFLQPFGCAWAGAAFPIAHRPNAPATYTKILGYTLIAAMFLIAVMTVFGRYLVIVFAGPAYVSATRLLPWLLLPLALRLLEYWSSLPLYLKYKTHWLAPLATVGAAVCVGLSLLLVPRIGALGAALAWVGALSGTILLIVAVGRRYYPLPIDWKTAGFAGALWTLGLLGGRLTGRLSPLFSLCTSFALAVLLLLSCVWYFRRDVRASKPMFTQGGAYAS